MSSILMTNFMFSNGANEDIRIILSFYLLILCMYDTGILYLLQAWWTLMKWCFQKTKIWTWSFYFNISKWIVFEKINSLRNKLNVTFIDTLLTFHLLKRRGKYKHVIINTSNDKENKLKITNWLIYAWVKSIQCN